MVDCKISKTFLATNKKSNQKNREMFRKPLQFSFCDVFRDVVRF